jgi:glyoxylase-like metal-dependent hydrolase (beta-lactamase superfamily II)
MSRFAVLLAFCASALSCATGGGRPASGPLADVDRALQAMGGAEKVRALESLVVKGTARHWEPEQSVKADGEPRLAGDSTFVAARALDARAARIEWDRKMVYPSPREYRFTEIVTPSAGYVEGLDTTAPTKQMQESGDPPRHAMSGVRLAAAQRELERTSPRLLAEMRADPSKLSRVPFVAVKEGNGLPAVKYQDGEWTFLVTFDGATGLPRRIRTLDADAIHGDSTYDLVLDDWRVVSGVKVAHALRYELNGREVIRIAYDEVRANPGVAADQLDIPAEIRASAPKPAGHGVPYQWVIRRQFIGTYLDSDAVSYDPGASPGLRLADLAPGVSQVVGGTHNSLAVELADHLVLVDAPVGESQAQWTLDALRARYPGKPVRWLVLSHHHMDHTSGARTIAAAGATVVVGAGNGAHFERVFAAPHRIDGDALQRSPRRVEVQEVADRRVLGDGRRRVELYRIDNPHAEGMLLTYVPDAKLGFVVDLWSPGRDELGEKPTPGQAALVAAVKKLDLAPQRFAGGHGTAAEYAPLAALAER